MILVWGIAVAGPLCFWYPPVTTLRKATKMQARWIANKPRRYWMIMRVRDFLLGADVLFEIIVGPKGIERYVLLRPGSDWHKAGDSENVPQPVARAVPDRLLTDVVSSVKDIGLVNGFLRTQVRVSFDRKYGYPKRAVCFQRRGLLSWDREGVDMEVLFFKDCDASR